MEIKPSQVLLPCYEVFASVLLSSSSCQLLFSFPLPCNFFYCFFKMEGTVIRIRKRILFAPICHTNNFLLASHLISLLIISHIARCSAASAALEATPAALAAASAAHEAALAAHAASAALEASSAASAALEASSAASAAHAASADHVASAALVAPAAPAALEAASAASAA